MIQLGIVPIRRYLYKAPKSMTGHEHKRSRNIYVFCIFSNTTAVTFCYVIYKRFSENGMEMEIPHMA